MDSRSPSPDDPVEDPAQIAQLRDACTSLYRAIGHDTPQLQQQPSLPGIEHLLSGSSTVTSSALLNPMDPHQTSLADHTYASSSSALQQQHQALPSQQVASSTTTSGLLPLSTIASFQPNLSSLSSGIGYPSLTATDPAWFGLAPAPAPPTQTVARPTTLPFPGVRATDPAWFRQASQQQRLQSTAAWVLTGSSSLQTAHLAPPHPPPPPPPAPAPVPRARSSSSDARPLILPMEQLRHQRVQRLANEPNFSPRTSQQGRFQVTTYAAGSDLFAPIGGTRNFRGNRLFRNIERDRRLEAPEFPIVPRPAQRGPPQQQFHEVIEISDDEDMN